MSVEDTTAAAPSPTPAPTTEPAATPAPADTTAAAAPAPAGESATDRDDKGRFRNPVQPRIDELTKKARENEREAAYWRQRAENAEKKPAAEPPKAPTADQFDDYGAYVTALAKFEAKQELKAELDERDKKSAETRQTETRVTKWQERQAEARKTIPDLDAVLAASDVPIANHVSAELLDSEFGPQIAYHLDKNPAIAERLNGMNEKQVAREIGRLEALFDKPPAAAADDSKEGDDPPAEPAAPAAAAARVTKAPPPVKPVGQGRSTAVDLSKASMDDYVSTRVAQGASWARR